jgi:hypothetical protein
MPSERSPELAIFSLIGICLMCVQQAEQGLQWTVETVLEDPEIRLSEQTEHEQAKTLGVFLRKLKRRAKLEPKLKDKLYHFLKMRNTFVHDFSEVPGWNLATVKGREIANEFLIELSLTAIAITALFMTVATSSAKKDFGKELFSEETEAEILMKVRVLEKVFGADARKILDGRYRKPLLAPNR